jgi:hypothetical protein
MSHDPAPPLEVVNGAGDSRGLTRALAALLLGLALKDQVKAETDDASPGKEGPEEEVRSGGC